MLRSAVLTAACLLLFSNPTLADDGATLRGSRASMLRQNRIAKQQDYTFLSTPAQVKRFVDEGYLVPVEGDDNYELANVSYPFARPALRTFVERLSAQYRADCGEKLVVTSLTRPRTGQPWNSHPLSVHPAGMAVDLRVSDRAACRAWLEETLLSLEQQDLLDITREHRPPHYHVALYPQAYMAHVGRLLSDSLSVARIEAEAAKARAEAEAREMLMASLSSPDTVHSSETSPQQPAAAQPVRTEWLPWTVLALVGAITASRFRRPRIKD